MSGILCVALEIYFVVILVRIVLSWFPIGPGSAIAPIYSVVHQATEPVLGTVRRVLPPVRMGGMGLDLSPIIVIFGISILRGVVC